MSFNVQAKLTAGVCICIGLLPSVHLAALQTATLLTVISVALDWRSIRLRQPLSWVHWLLLLFIVYSIANTLLYGSLPGNQRHYFKVALETWCITLLAFFVTIAFSRQRNIRPALITWLPVGLILSFAIMTVFFFSRIEGHRPDAFAPNTLYPPLWFLILTGVSFCWFETMSRSQKIIRFVLLGLAGIMTIYGGARLILIAWVFLGTYLLYFATAQQSKLSGPYRFTLIVLGVSGTLLIASGLDILFNGAWALTYRFSGALRAALQQDTQFLRPQLWAESWRWIEQHPWLGYGQINERFLLREIGPSAWWYRAHQTYLSFWIGGGVIGLVIGLLFQFSALGLVYPGFKRALAPATVALLGVTILNGMTDSIFQSLFAVQVYLFLIILLYSQREQEQPTRP